MDTINYQAIAAYVTESVEFFAERYDLALCRMGASHLWGVQYADESLYNDICNAVEDYCIDNEINIDYVDIEEVEEYF